ncbi:hypothetical protein [Halobellus inordinatus]|uniref:hypothetical protein n=1 Tax=Halobellus inordinatus TaxID=1126236 RepID=UPI00210E659E|nr:hypothetical protein [Halobellus inordinatus]
MPSRSFRSTLGSLCVGNDPYATSKRRRLAAASLVGGFTVLLSVALVACWLVLTTAGPLGRLSAVTTMTGGKPVPAAFVPVWAYGGAMGLPVTLVETTGGGRTMVVRNTVELLDGPGSVILGVLPATLLVGAGAVSAQCVYAVRSNAGGFAGGAAVTGGYVTVAVLLALLARVGVGDAPVGAQGYVRIGVTGFPPETLAGDTVGLPPWRSAFTTLVAAIGFGGFGGALSSVFERTSSSGSGETASARDSDA